MSKEIIRLSGLVDTHVHLREPGATQKEDFETGTKAAIAGGYTAVLDMPNNPEPTITPDALQKKIQLAGNRIYCDVGFHFGGTKESSQYFEEVRNEVFGLKVYMNHTTETLLVEDPQDLQTVFSRWPRGKIIMVHAEGETLRTAIDLARDNHQRLHVCHVSQKQEIEAIKDAKERGVQITCEVSAHHLFLTEHDVPALGSFGIMRPPLATEKDRQALWDNLDVVDTIASDHAPHTKEEKASQKPPFGVPGLETTLPLLLTAVADGRLTLYRLFELISLKPRLIFGLRPNPETYTEIDLKENYIIDSSKLKTKVGWTPFEGARVTGKVVRTVLHGDVVFDGEEIKEPPRGKVIYPY